MGKRKPFPEIVEAFTRASGDHLRLLIRGQVDRKAGKLEKAAGGDPRVVIELEDRPTDEHLRQFAGCHVCLSPSRWEGLGLPLYEAVAFGMPSITNDSPPMNEIVLDGVNGDLRRLRPLGRGRLGDPRLRSRLRPAHRGDRAARRRRPSASGSPPARASCARAIAAGGARSRASRSCSAADARRRRQQVVQPRPAGGRTPAALGGRRARPRDVRARAAEEGARPAPGGARPRRRLGPARGDRGVGLRRARRASTTPGSRRTGSRRSSAIRTTSSRSWRSCARAACATIGRFVWEHFTAEHVAGAARGLRRRLLAHPRRAGALPRRWAWRRPTCRGAATRSWSRSVSAREPQPRTRRRARHASSFPGGSSGIASRSSRCSRRSRRPTTRACGWWSRRRSSASRSAPRPRPPSATRGSSCGSPTSRPPSTCARSRAATSASPRRAGRASGCRCTRRSPSGCRRSPTTRRR